MKTHNFYNLRYDKKAETLTIGGLKTPEEHVVGEAAVQKLGGIISSMDEVSVTVENGTELAKKMSAHGVSFVGARNFVQKDGVTPRF